MEAVRCESVSPPRDDYDNFVVVSFGGEPRSESDEIPRLSTVLKELGALSAHGRLDDLVGIEHRFAALDLIDVFHAGDDLAPGGVLLVEKTGVVETDEKL